MGGQIAALDSSLGSMARWNWRRLARPAKGAIGILLFLGAWQISVPLVGLEPYFYPAPTDVWSAFVDLMRKGILPVYIVDSLQRYASGLALA